MQKAIVFVGVLAVLAAGCGGDDDDGSAAGGGTVTIQLSEQSGSGESGTATLTADGDRTRVVVDISNGTATPQPAHIHEGSCENLNPQPEYALQNVVNGMSTSTVNATLEDLKSEAYAINVHKSAADLKTYVSCGDIGGKGGDSDEGGTGY